jgi:ribosomal protein S18 acetylase RimI-like enzyme
MTENAAQGIHVERATDPDFAACESILRELPDWFGIEKSIVDYVGALDKMHTFVGRLGVRVAGFLALTTHNGSTSEIYVMAVAAQFQRMGIGRALVQEAVRIARSRGQKLLEVKTLGPSHPDTQYAATRRFYEAMGFVPLEEVNGLWPGNPCLIMVKVLEES